MLTLLLFLGLADVEGAKTVWVDPYTRRDGTYVQGHWRSPPVSNSLLVGLSTPVSTYEPQNVITARYLTSDDRFRFERGFVGDQPFAKLVIDDRDPRSKLTVLQAKRQRRFKGFNQLEFSCVRTSNGFVTSVDLLHFYPFKTLQTRKSLDNESVNVWIEDKVYLEITTYNAFHKYGLGHSYSLKEILVAIDSKTFHFHESRQEVQIKEFLDTCHYLSR